MQIADKKVAIAFGRYSQKPYLCTALMEMRQLAPSREQRKVYLSLPRRKSQSRICEANAAIAQLVEHDLAKVGVASSSLVCRSKVDL